MQPARILACSKRYWNSSLSLPERLKRTPRYHIPESAALCVSLIFSPGFLIESTTKLILDSFAVRSFQYLSLVSR